MPGFLESGFQRPDASSYASCICRTARRHVRTVYIASDFAHELRPHDVAAVALYPGLVRTEAVLDNAAYFDLSNSESPQFVGRVIAGLGEIQR